MFDNILWFVKKNYLSFRPKKCKNKTNKLLNISKGKFHLYHLKLTKRNRKRESSTLFLFGRIYYVTFCFGSCQFVFFIIYNIIYCNGENPVIIIIIIIITEKTQAKRVKWNIFQIERVKENENVETGVIYNIGIKLVKY